jgi:simple sugar transport system permease protein
MQFELREQTPLVLLLSVPIIAVLCSLVIASCFIIWAGQSPIEGFSLIITGAFGSSFALTETLAKTIPLIFTGLAAAVAFRAKFWNIGAEGQLYCGALAATWLGTGLVELPSYLMIPFLIVVGMMAGAAILMLPVFLKNKLNVDEVVTTLLLNFVILLFVGYCLEGPLKDPMSMGWPQAEPIIDEGVFPQLVERSRLHIGLIFALIAAFVSWMIFRFTLWGFEIRALGMNATAARHAGINPNWTIFKVALLSGGLAGLAGVSEVAGLKGYLTLDLSPGFGYTGIAVAMLANLHPLGIILSALFLASIFVGADFMGRTIGVPNFIADIMVATSVLSILIGLLLCKYKIKLHSSKKLQEGV